MSSFLFGTLFIEFLGIPAALATSRDVVNFGADAVAVGSVLLTGSGVDFGVVSGVSSCVGSCDDSVSVSITLSSVDVWEALTINGSVY